MELTKEIKEILENVVYWDTCPKDYKDKIKAYLKSVNESEALSIHDVSCCSKEELEKEYKFAEFEFVNWYKNTFMYQLIDGNVIVSFTAEYRDSLDKIENIENLAEYDDFYIH